MSSAPLTAWGPAAGGAAPLEHPRHWAPGAGADEAPPERWRRRAVVAAHRAGTSENPRHPRALLAADQPSPYGMTQCARAELCQRQQVRSLPGTAAVLLEDGSFCAAGLSSSRSLGTYRQQVGNMHQPTVVWVLAATKPARPLLPTLMSQAAANQAAAGISIVNSYRPTR